VSLLCPDAYIVNVNMLRFYNQAQGNCWAENSVELPAHELTLCMSCFHCCCCCCCPRRSDPIIAIGGGVCLDVAGLAANLYRRNTAIIKVGGNRLIDVLSTALNFLLPRICYESLEPEEPRSPINRMPLPLARTANAVFTK
jgi:hypothetical protein